MDFGDKKPMALVAPISGLAVVVEPDDRVFVLRHNKPGQPEDATGYNIPMLLQGFGELEEREADAYPYPELYRYMEIEYRKRCALTNVRDAMCQIFSVDLRQALADEAEQLLSDDAVFAFVRERILAEQLPSGLVFKDLTNGRRYGEIMRALLAKHDGR